jgi:hypothetical protein
MRHLIVGAALVLIALAVTSMTAALLEQAAMNRQSGEGAPAVVESPDAPPSKASPGKSGQVSELARQAQLISRRLTANLKD